MRKITVAITSIGSGVGQSVVDSCRLSGLPLAVLGYGNSVTAFGAFDCDRQRIIPSIYDNNYIDVLLDVCLEDRVDLVIPGLDDELELLSRNREHFAKIGVEIIVSQPAMLRFCRDKEFMSRELNQVVDCFVASYSQSDAMSELRSGRIDFPLIAKPSSGFASRGLRIIWSSDDLLQLADHYVVQEIASPHKRDPHREAFDTALSSGEVKQVGELSLQLLFGKNGAELGRFASYNKLAAGVPVEIVPANVSEAWAVVDKLVPAFQKAGVYGPLNIQGRLTDAGPRFFEMNARFTGITGLRALMGFNEVEAVVAEALGFRGAQKLTGSMRKIGLRQVKNRVLDPLSTKDLAEMARATGVYNDPPSPRTVLVTGANSYLGRIVIDVLLAHQMVGAVVALVREPSRFCCGSGVEFPEPVTLWDAATLEHGELQLGEIDVVCHLASARPVHTPEEIAQSLAFTNKLIRACADHQIPGFINASSQSVYGTNNPPLWSEDTPPAPETPYGQSKFASELLVASLLSINKPSATISLRIAQCIGPSQGLVRESELAHKFVKKAINDEELLVLGGEQQLDWINVYDAASVIATLAATAFDRWPATLNVGAGEPVSVKGLAERIISVTGSRSEVSVIPDCDFPSYGMEIARLKEFGWAPLYDLDQTIKAIATSFNDEP